VTQCEDALERWCVESVRRYEVRPGYWFPVKGCRTLHPITATRSLTLTHSCSILPPAAVLIAYRMAMFIVNRFEVIDIDHDAGKAVPVSLGPVKLRLKSFKKARRFKQRFKGSWVASTAAPDFACGFHHETSPGHSTCLEAQYSAAQSAVTSSKVARAPRILPAVRESERRCDHKSPRIAIFISQC